VLRASVVHIARLSPPPSTASLKLAGAPTLCCLFSPVQGPLVVPRLLAAALLLGACEAEWTGILGLSFESDTQVDQRTMLCPSGFITGLKVRQGRDEKDDIDTYDFQLQCGRRWSAWSGMPFKGLRQEKSFECPMKMSMTGLEVTKGRKEWGDVDTYDFKLQCSGVWQEYMGLGVSNSKERAARECPDGTMAWGWKAYRGFVKKGDQDYYEFDLNCKPAADASAAVRKSPSPREIGLSPNVFLWSPKDVGTWLGALGLAEYAPAFVENRLQASCGSWNPFPGLYLSVYLYVCIGRYTQISRSILYV